MPKFVAVDKVIHKAIKIKEDKTFSHLKKQHVTSLVLQEFSIASHDYPIVFVKDNETGQFRSAAMLGLKPGENLFFDSKGWKANYKPESILGYPFVLTNSKNSQEQKVLVMDEDCERINQTEGIKLFNEDGTPTTFINNVGNFLSSHLNKQIQTQSFIKTLLDYDLIIPQSLEISTKDNEKQTINGLYIIGEEEFNNLTDDRLLHLRKNGFLSAIYSHFFSMTRIASLIKMSNN
ncbi:MAG: SapC family protein [Kangiellaceae bacterium]